VFASNVSNSQLTPGKEATHRERVSSIESSQLAESQLAESIREAEGNGSIRRAIRSMAAVLLDNARLSIVRLRLDKREEIASVVKANVSR